MENLNKQVSEAEGVFSQLFSLNEEVAIYVPSTVNATTKVDSIAMVKYIMSQLSIQFGGATAYKAQGGWMSTEHGLIVEEVTIIRACADKITKAQAEKVLELAQEVKIQMSQEAVSVEYNRKLMFV